MSRQEIANLLPHGNAMSIIDRVVACSEKNLIAETESHQQQDHPLYMPECSSVLLIEYAAQAAAVHAALNQAGLGAARPAYLGAVKNIQLHMGKLKSSLPVLTISVSCVFSDSSGAIYDMNISTGDERVIDGRLVLVQPEAGTNLSGLP